MRKRRTALAAHPTDHTAAMNLLQTEHNGSDIIAPLPHSLPLIKDFSQTMTDLVSSLSSHLE